MVFEKLNNFFRHLMSRKFITIKAIHAIVVVILLIWIYPLIRMLWLHKPVVRNVQLLHHLQLLPVHNGHIRRDHHWLGLWSNHLWRWFVWLNRKQFWNYLWSPGTWFVSKTCSIWWCRDALAVVIAPSSVALHSEGH